MTRFAFVDREKAFYPVNLLCDLLKVSLSGYYAWRGRAPSKRRLADEVLAEQIGGFYTASRHTYGAPRIHSDLIDAGVHVGRSRADYAEERLAGRAPPILAALHQGRPGRGPGG